MTKMNSLIHQLVPQPEERWHRGGVDFQDYALSDGRTVTAPVFDIADPKLRELKSDELRDERGRAIGKVVEVASFIHGEPARRNRLWIHDSEHGEYIKDGTALGTGIDGYTAARAEALFIQGSNVMQGGVEYSYDNRSLLRRLAFFPVDIAKAGLYAHKMSLMKSAQGEQATEAALRKKYGFGEVSLQLGDSQPAIKQPGTVFYNENLYGGVVAGIEPRAVLCNEGLDEGNVLESSRWLVEQGLGLAAMIGDMVVRGDTEALKQLKATPDTHLTFVMGAVFGSTPALLAGELGATLPLLRRDIGGTRSIFALDHLLRKSARSAAEKLPYLNHIVVPASHMHVADRKFWIPQVERVGREMELIKTGTHLGDATYEQATQIYGNDAEVLERIGKRVAA